MSSKENEKEDNIKFMRIVEKQASPIIEERVKKLAEKGKVLSYREEQEIMKKVAKKIKRKRKIRETVRGIIVALGFSTIFGAGMKTQKLLNEAENKGITQTEKMITIDPIDAQKDVNIKNNSENTNARKIFINGVQVGKDDIKQNINKEIEQLKTKQDVLRYVKNMFIQENNYNQLKESDIEIYKNQSDIKVYKDTAKNGDDILRYDYSTKGYEKGVYTITIQTEDGLEKQKIARNSDDKSIRIYDADEIVEEYSENEISKLGNIIMQGTDYAIAIGEENGVTEKNLYKERLVNAISEYREEKIEKIIKGEEYRSNSSNLKREEQEI